MINHYILFLFNLINIGLNAHTINVAKIDNVPDIDQVRNDLPGSGSMFCGPTSIANVLISLHYKNKINTNTYPELQEFISALEESKSRSILINQIWNDHQVYQRTNDLINQIGIDTSIDISSGVNTFAIIDFFEINFPELQVELLDNKFDQDYEFSIQTFIDNLREGNHIILLYGYYSTDAIGKRRTGGHFVTVTGAQRTLTENKIIIHDPSTCTPHGFMECDGNSQGIMKTNQLRMEPIEFFLKSHRLFKKSFSLHKADEEYSSKFLERVILIKSK